MRFVFDPPCELRDIRVSSQSFERVVLALQLFDVDSGVDVLVAGTAKQRDTAMNVLPVEHLLVTLVLVPRLRNQMMARQFVHQTATKLAVAGSVRLRAPVCARLKPSSQHAADYKCDVSPEQQPV